MENIDVKLHELKQLDGLIDEMSAKKDTLRKEIFGYIEDNGLTDGYKNDIATVSYVERKTVKIKDQEKLVKYLTDNKLTKYFEVIPEQVIPEHTEVKAELTKDIKAGKFEHEEIEVETATNLAVKFA